MASSEAPVLRTVGGILLESYTFIYQSDKPGESKNSIFKRNYNNSRPKCVGGGEETIPESNKVELKVKICE